MFIKKAIQNKKKRINKNNKSINLYSKKICFLLEK